MRQIGGCLAFGTTTWLAGDWRDRIVWLSLWMDADEMKWPP